MKIWPERMLVHLPNKTLLDLHRDCCALRGRAWARNNKEVNYVFKRGPYILEAYHFKVLKLLQERNVHFLKTWLRKKHRGLKTEPWSDEELYGPDYIYKQKVPYPTGAFYEEHDQEYWTDCKTYLRLRKIKPVKRIPKEQPSKGTWSKQASCGGHLCACVECGFTLISDEDSCCPRCEAPIDNKAQPEAVLIDPAGDDIFERKMMSHDALRLSNIVFKGTGLIWRYVSFPDRMRYRRWLGRRMKREDENRRPLAEEILPLMKSTMNSGRAIAFLPRRMSKEEKRKAFRLWKQSQEDGTRNKIKGKVKL